MDIDYSRQLAWLVRLRWSAVFGQTLILLIAEKLFELSLPVFFLWSIIVFFALTNLALHLYTRKKEYPPRAIIGSVLTLDTFILTALLYWSGGPSNPFSIVYLVHVTIAALLLGSIWTWVTVGLSLICFAGLFQFHYPIPELAMSHHHDASNSFSFHLYGMLLAFGLVATLTGFFLTRMTDALRAQEQAIQDLKLITAHHERLAALTTLAAGAAHELNTPLGTIAIAAKELSRELIKSEASPDSIEDAQLILSQIERCKGIIDKMSGQSGEISGELHIKIPNEELMSHLKAEVGEGADRLDVEVPRLNHIYAPPKGLIQALSSLIKNALDASGSQKRIKLIIDADEDGTSFSVIDSGTGIPSELIPRIGEPFFTTKDPGKGMGLGVFLAKLFATRLGGSLEIRSRTGEGTRAILHLPQLI